MQCTQRECACEYQWAICHYPRPQERSTFSTLDLHAIRDIASSAHVFEMLVASVCPSIFGHEVCPYDRNMHVSTRKKEVSRPPAISVHRTLSPTISYNLRQQSQVVKAGLLLGMVGGRPRPSVGERAGVARRSG